MIEDLKQVRDALEYCHERLSDKGVFETITEKALATLDSIIADHIPDASKMVVPDGYKLVPIELSDENYLYSHPMVNAGFNAWRDASEKGLLVSTMLMNIYKAMLYAAPTPAQPENIKYEESTPCSEILNSLKDLMQWVSPQYFIDEKCRNSMDSAKNIIEFYQANQPPEKVSAKDFPYDRSDYVVQHPIHRDKNGKLTDDPVEKLDVEALKWEVLLAVSPNRNHTDVTGSEMSILGRAIDHLAATGRLKV